MNRDEEVLNEFNPTLLHDFYFARTTNVILPLDMSGTLEPVLLKVNFSTASRHALVASGFKLFSTYIDAS